MQVQSAGRSTAKDVNAMATQFDERYHVSESAASLAKVTAVEAYHSSGNILEGRV